MNEARDGASSMGRMSRGSHLLLLGCMAAAFVQGLGSLWNEWQVAEALAMQRDQAMRRSDDLASPPTLPMAAPFPAPPARAVMVHAILRLRAAGQLAPGPRRSALISAGFADAQAASIAMPHSGTAALVSCYAYVMRDGQRSPQALHAFARSYAAHGYLLDAADWRLRYAATQWAYMDHATRAAVVREGQWLGRFDRARRMHVYVLTGGTPAWTAINGSATPPFRR